MTRLILALILALALSTEALSVDSAHYDSPQPNTDSKYLALSVPEVLKYMSDPGNRIPPVFKVPDSLRDAVGFWLLVYTKYSLHHTLVQDREVKGVFYEAIDNRDFFEKGQGPVALEINSKNRLKKRLEEYRLAFDKLIRNPRAKFPALSAGENIVTAWKNKAKFTSAHWRAAKERIRTQAGQRDRILQGITMADRFFPAMETIFEKHDLPAEISRLPLVESSFNMMAVSKVDAVGVWQFMEKSALEYLKVDPKNKIDERLSPIKSTYAAAQMFKRNVRLLRDVGLAVIAYNHGPKNLLEIRDKYKGEKIGMLLTSKKSPLGYASSNFYAEFLAVLVAEKYREIFFGLPVAKHDDAISIVEMKKPASVFDIATMYGVSLHELRLFNPDIFDLKRRLPKGTRIVIPRKLNDSLVQMAKRNASRVPANESSVLPEDVKEISFP